MLAGLEGELGPRCGEPVSLDGGIMNRNLRAQFGVHEAVVRLPGTESYADEHLGRVAAAFADPRVEGRLGDARG